MHMEALQARLRTWQASRSERMLSAARVLGLGALLWAVAGQASHQFGGLPWPVPLLMVTASVGWVGWLAGRSLGAPEPVVWSSLLCVVASGGALAGYAPIAVTFIAVAGLGAAIAFDTIPAAAVATVGVITLVATVLALGTPALGEVIAEGALSGIAGLMVGTSRRQYLDRAAQAEQLLAERTRADAERDNATALAERNRLGREVHDVLAHSLGALSVQLDAADALLEAGGDPEKARLMVRQARQLAVQGLEETREAVHALRDDPVELAERLTVLAQRAGAAITVHGQPRPLDPNAGLALYRVAQEALTNARKHAPGAPVMIRLDFGDGATRLRVANGPCPGGSDAGTRPNGSLAETGGGFGLRGMRERVELLGGDLRAEPAGTGWAVQAAVPG
jgi:signal transduction histidine kinase